MNAVTSPDSQIPDGWYRRLFESAPGCYLVLEPIEFRILAVSDAYLAATLSSREELVGVRLFDRFPDQPDDALADGVRNLRASLDRVRSTLRRDVMGVQRYPIPLPPGRGGGFEERFWTPINVPVLADDGRLQAIIHRVEDVTDVIVAPGGAGEDAERLRREADVVARSRELQAAMDRVALGETMLAMKGRIAHIGAWVVFLPEFRVVWSPETYRLHGEPVGHGPPIDEAINYYKPPYRPVITAAVERCVREGEAFDIVAELERADGRVIWVRSLGEAVRDASGAITHIQGTIQDITDRVAAEAENALLAERLHDTLESITDAFFTLDAQWRFTYINAEAERLLQRPRAELLGKDVWREFPDAVGSRFDTEYRRALAEGVTVSFEEYFPPLDLWAEVRAYPSLGGLAIYFRDITARRAAEEQLRLLQTSIERLNDIVLITEAEPIDEPGPRIVYVNEAFERRTGYAREEVLGQTPRILQGPGTSREELDRVRGALEAWEPVRAELLNYTKAGEPFWLELEIVPLANEQGWYTHWIAVERDITERKAAEEQLKLQARLLNEASDAILVRDLAHRIQFWNSGAERIYGWTAAEVQGRPATEIIYHDPAAFLAATEAVVANGRWSGELEQFTRDGRRVIVEGRWTLLLAPDGAPTGVLAINSDVTERRKLEQQFLRAQRLESIGTLAGGIAHDLNNVLAPILLSTDLLRLSALDDDTRETVETIRQSARRGAEMVSQVLSFARGVEGERVVVRVPTLLDDVHRILRDSFPKDIQVEIVSSPDLPSVMGDPTQLHQVLLNLCVNARDAMPDGGSLTIRASVVDLDAQYSAMNVEATPGRYVRIEVEDTGAGIPAEVLDKIYDPFFTTKPIGKGSGLGLSTSLAIIKSHDGFIRAYSDPGVGTQMRVYLPAAAALTGSEPVHRDTELPRGHGELILVVDDEAAIRQITSQTLEAFGYSCLLAADGAEAVALYAERQDDIAVVLTDMMMPVMDGVATIRVLQRLNPGVRIIAASGITANGKVAQATGLGIHHFLPKPYTAQTLLSALRQVLAP